MARSTSSSSMSMFVRLTTPAYTSWCRGSLGGDGAQRAGAAAGQAVQRGAGGLIRREVDAEAQVVAVVGQLQGLVVEPELVDVGMDQTDPPGAALRHGASVPDVGELGSRGRGQLELGRAAGEGNV